MRRVASGMTALALLALAACTPATAHRPDAGPGTPAPKGTQTRAAGPQADYLVFYADGKQSQAMAAVTQAGGTSVGEDARLGYLLARGARDGFAESVGGDPSVVGVSPDRSIGHATAEPVRSFPDGSALRAARASGEPLAGRQWDMRMIGADRAHAKAPGSKDVLVAVIDTGIDGKHPDIAPNFDRELSRNFVTDKPKDDNGETLDGPCEAAGCKDPVDEDDDGHGTHVASTIASPVNGIGIAGVAPGVRLVNVRAGQDSGFFFLKPSLDALAYAADIGADVANLSYYVDPWLFNCARNPGDSRKEQLEQQAVITGMQRAVDYARKKGVTIVSALGNGSSDLGDPKVDDKSPGYPEGSQKTRKVDNTCINVPAESDGVISVSALGPSGRKAVYSDYGVEQTDVAAPGGDAVDGKGAKATRSILAAAPERALRAAGRLDADGRPKGSDVVRDCSGGSCSYYQYLDGTSMAAPHATGVAALLVSRFGKPAPGGGLTLDPATVEKYLYASADRRSCPTPRQYVYQSYGQSETHTCQGDEADNGFFGHGIVDAWKAVTFEP
ncbi:S8 family serine peptidase [Actinomadura sp. ATCC 31491]|uniref:S8 family serine peptidase n=1 Tax=Actinomadura luzonensis TaxID=2805427 RepID=A0ABT0G9L2_9ACTN|nr:S8 family serine peptidase [Actinomadura luzonensis]MCK2220920.1 S8 family serine peptidase [Actinomadura luzonensis]